MSWIRQQYHVSISLPLWSSECERMLHLLFSKSYYFWAIICQNASSRFVFAPALPCVLHNASKLFRNETFKKSLFVFLSLCLHCCRRIHNRILTARRAPIVLCATSVGHRLRGAQNQRHFEWRSFRYLWLNKAGTFEAASWDKIILHFDRFRFWNELWSRDFQDLELRVYKCLMV